MRLLRSSWKLLVFSGITLIAVLRSGAPTTLLAAPKPAPSASPSATPAPDYAAEVAKLKTADELFDYIMTIDIGGHKLTMDYGVSIEASALPATEDAQMNKLLGRRTRAVASSRQNFPPAVPAGPASVGRAAPVPSIFKRSATLIR